MRILVAGGQGQVGSALANVGKEQGLDLVALGRSKLDITDATSIAAIFEECQPNLLINAAAYTAVDKAESQPELAYAVNETATALLAEACKTANIPMLHISTDYVFDGSKEGLYTEDDPVNPLAVYAKSKEAGERALRARVQRHIILRTSWVFGTQGDNFVKTMVRLAKERDRLTVVADQFGAPTSATGIATALLGIAERFEQSEEISWGTYHFNQKPYLSWYQFAQHIIERSYEKGIVDHRVELVPIKSSEYSSLAKRPKNSRLSTLKYEESFKTEASAWIDELEDFLSYIKKESL